MRKRTAALYVLILLIVLLGLTNVARLRLADLASWVVNTAPTVIPSLREWQGASGTFTMVGTSRIVVDPSYIGQLQDTPQVFQSDLLAITRHKLPLVVSRSPATGDFFLTVSNADHDLGSEGYRLKIADYVTISALTRTGVFYGTRTVLQILLQDPTQTQMPQGTARDYPQYAERGFMLDAARKFFSITSLEDYVKLMAWYKMNDFQILSE